MVTEYNDTEEKKSKVDSIRVIDISLCSSYQYKVLEYYYLIGHFKS